MAKTVISGHKQLRERLKRLSRDGRKKVVQAMMLQGHKILNTSNDKYVPRLDGTLRNSGTVRKTKDTKRDVSVQIAYGGAASAYALAVHEHLSEHSPPSWKAAEAAGNPVQFGVDLTDRPNVGPKFLERALNDHEGELLDDLSKAIDFEDLV